MLIKIKEKEIGTMFMVNAILGLFLLFGLIIPVFGQVDKDTQIAVTQTASEKKVPTALMPVLTDNKGIKIGTTAEEVRDKLGKAKIDDKDGFFYESDDEMIQIRLDADKKVRLVSVTYLNGNENTPKYADIFGAEIPAQTKPDGSIYNLVRYPEAGYWVAYSKTAGEKPLVMVTMQKL